MVSSSAGTKSPRNEKNIAPTKPMNGANFGTMTAATPIPNMQPARNPI